MGAKDGFLIETEAPFSHDPNGAGRPRSTTSSRKRPLPFDAIFTGVQSEDDQFASVGGILAAKLGLPYASMVIGIDAFEQDHAMIRRELEGGLQERIKVALPCVLGIQSGINEPRYVSIMGIRKASKVERKVFKAGRIQRGRGRHDRPRAVGLPARRRAGRPCCKGSLTGSARSFSAS